MTPLTSLSLGSGEKTTGENPAAIRLSLFLLESKVKDCEHRNPVPGAKRSLRSRDIGTKVYV